jgi:hypothetical protein
VSFIIIFLCAQVPLARRAVETSALLNSFSIVEEVGGRITDQRRTTSTHNATIERIPRR